MHHFFGVVNDSIFVTVCYIFESYPSYHQVRTFVLTSACKNRQTIHGIHAIFCPDGNGLLPGCRLGQR